MHRRSTPSSGPELPSRRHRDSSAATPGTVLSVGTPHRRAAIAANEVMHVCTNIRTLYDFEPPATDDEIRAAALPYVRKISGFTNPSAANRGAIDSAVDEVARVSATLLGALVTTAAPKDREVEAARAHARAERRFGPAR